MSNTLQTDFDLGCLVGSVTLSYEVTKSDLVHEFGCETSIDIEDIKVVDLHWLAKDEFGTGHHLEFDLTKEGAQAEATKGLQSLIDSHPQDWVSLINESA